MTGASTRALLQRALFFALFELLLICGVNDFVADGGQDQTFNSGKLPKTKPTKSPNHLLWSCELPPTLGRASVESLTTNYVG